MEKKKLLLLLLLPLLFSAAWFLSAERISPIPEGAYIDWIDIESRGEENYALYVIWRDAQGDRIKVVGDLKVWVYREIMLPAIGPKEEIYFYTLEELKKDWELSVHEDGCYLPGTIYTYETKIEASQFTPTTLLGGEKSFQYQNHVLSPEKTKLFFDVIQSNGWTRYNIAVEFTDASSGKVLRKSTKTTLPH